MALTQNALYYEAAQRVRHRISQGLEASKALYHLVAMTVPSTTDREDYDWLGAFPKVREWLGDMVFEQMASADFTIKNREFYAGIRLNKQKIDDGNTGYFDNLIPGLVEQMDRHPDKLMFEFLEDAEAYEGFDGQYFFDTDHSWGDSGTQSNLLTTAVVDKDVPTKAELRALFQNILTKFLSYKNDKGEAFAAPDATTINDLVVFCPLKYYFLLDEAFNGTMKVEGGAAVPNYTVVKPTFIPMAHMTGDYFDVFRTGQSIKPLVFQDRESLSTFQEGADKPTQRDILVGAKARHNIGGLAWWLAIRQKLTTAS
ncbi:Mu-like prophage major head subunit gpT family protein [Stieleria sp. JC731]|uniref:Mu-like prophage major head subunit gpT family protein n=1 Tax=Pirellulaceae TaxID=2691357 RepID=UPI001E477B11|nr:Mu-like prophage major head subunit gpT family protein [Stieleria sp. JC731]MCC9603506.1 Mu-like prophage major head subunit gpT family protein [Stieleria sp. JC731]